MTFEFRRPLGIVFSGGGAHGAWQTGCLEGLTQAGLEFDKVFGFSIGALTAAGYFLRLQSLMVDRWRNMDGNPILRFAPRLRTCSLYSHEPVWEAARKIGDDEQAKIKARCELIVVSQCLKDWRHDYARFTPFGRGGWDGPLASKLVGSCSIPVIFPPVSTPAHGLDCVLVDGCVPGKEPMRFDALADCGDIIVLQVTRLDEVGKLSSWLRRGTDQIGREACHLMISRGIESLEGLARRPRVFRFYPSSVLDYSQLDFQSRHCAPALEQGLSDVQDLLKNQFSYLA